MRQIPHRFSHVMVVVFLCMMVMPGMVGVARAASSQVVGNSTVEANGEWLYSAESSSSNAATFTHASLVETYFMRQEHALSQLAVQDNLFLMEAYTIPAFRDAFGIAEMPQLGTGDPTGPTLWYAHSMDLSGFPYIALFAVSVTAVPDTAAVEIMIAPQESFALALPSAQQGFTFNGQPGLFAGVDANAVLAAAGLQGGAPVDPAVQQTPVATTGTGTQVDPACDSVANPGLICNTYEYGGDWVVAPDISMSGSGGGFGLDHQVLGDTFFMYSESPWVPNHIPDNESLIQSYAIAYLSQLGQLEAIPVATGTLADGTLWHLYAAPVEGVQSGVLLTVDTADPAQVDVITMLSSPVSDFDVALAAVQSDIRVNGVSPLDGIDPAQATAALQGGSVPVENPTPTPPAVATTQQSGGLAADYQAQDAATGCDAIGWAITDPSQLPASQADLDYRSSCVGGATYVASCGTFDASSSWTLVQCTVNVSVGSAPMFVSADDFTLVDGSGAEYALDWENLMPAILLFGVAELPEATVDPGTNVAGTIMFNVPTGAPGPWVIQVAPETAGATGEAPGTLVIDGELQPFEVFE